MASSDQRRMSLEDRRPSIVYEEDMSVIVRRRGVTMTVRIFGAEEDTVSTVSKETSSDKNPGEVKKIEEDDTTPTSSPVKSPGASVKRTYFQKLRRTLSNSLSPDQSGDDQTPMQSPTTPALSPSTPDKKVDLLRAESPTKGIGQFHKGRSSSIATSQTIRPSRIKNRRFSVDSVPRRRLFRLFSRKVVCLSGFSLLLLIHPSLGFISLKIHNDVVNKNK